MRRYHHIGIPTTESRPGETHLKNLKLFVVSHQKSEFGVEWMRFEADAAVPDLIRRVAHVAFEVTDLSSELVGREILIPPNSPSDGVRVAFIVENGAPIEPGPCSPNTPLHIPPADCVRAQVEGICLQNRVNTDGGTCLLLLVG